MADQRHPLDTEGVDDAEDAAGLRLTAVGAGGRTLGESEGRQVERHRPESGRGRGGERLAPQLAPRAHAVHEEHHGRVGGAELLHEHVDVGGADEPTTGGRGLQARLRLARMGLPAEHPQRQQQDRDERRRSNEDHSNDPPAHAVSHG